MTRVSVDFDRIAEAISPDQLGEALGVRKVRGGWHCPSPDHTDQDPSFSIFRDGPRTVGRCHGCDLRGSPVTVASRVWGVEPGDAAEELVRRIGISLASVSTNGRGHLGEIAATYDYVDENGELLFQVVRFEPKTFRQRRPDGAGGWEWSTRGVRRELYRLPEVLEALENGRVVWIVEGEKDADRLVREGLVATTPPGGAGKWRPSYTKTLSGAQVIVLPDQDEPGQEHGETVARQLHAAGCEVRILTLPALPRGGDVSDFLDREGDGEELKKLARETEPWEPGSDLLLATTDEDPTLTDAGNSSRLAQLHGQRLRFVPRWGKWLVEDGGFWSLDHEDVRVRELAKDVGRSLKREAAEEPDKDRAEKMFKWGLRSLSSGRIGAMVNLARGIEGIPLDHEKLDADGWLLGAENGVIDLRTGRPRPADPSDLLTLRCPVEWDEDATAPRWSRALEEWFPDPDVRAYVKRVAGASLVGAQRDHAFIIHYGLGGNGKGTFTRALQTVLGPYAVEVHLSLLVETKYKEHDTVKADLFRKRLAVAVETERRIRLAEASVKNLTGGDRIRARRMREDPWSFDPTHSLWLQTNHLPEISGRDEGIWRRIRVVKWENTFRGQEAEKDLDETLAAEAPGVLRWLVEGCLEWQEHGLDEPEKVVRDTLAYREKEDIFSRFQNDVGLVFSPDLEIQAAELQDILGEWASEEGIDRPQGATNWLRENGCRKKQRTVTNADGSRSRPKFWVGAGFEDDKHRTEQTNALA